MPSGATRNAICEAAICYTGDILDPARTKYSLDYYVRMAKRLVGMGTHILGIKDMAGLCKPYAAYALVKALRDEIDVPIHFHTHDTSGINAAQHPARGRCRRGHRRRRDRLDERHDQSALAEWHRGGASAHRARHRPRSGGTGRTQPLLGSGAGTLLPVRGGTPGAERRRVPTRDAGRAIHQPPPAGQDARSRRALGGCLPRVCRGQPAVRRHRQGDAVEQSGRRPRTVHGDERPDRERHPECPRRR